MRVLSLFLAAIVPVFAEPKRTGEVELPITPNTEKELKAWLEGTKWVTEDKTRLSCIFVGSKFETPLAKPTFTIKSRRAVVMNWGNGVKTTVVFSSDCSTMREIDGLQVAYKFDGRIPVEEMEKRKSRLPDKPGKK